MGMKKTDMIRCVYIFLAFFYPFSWPFVVFIVISIYNLYLVFWTEAWMGLDSSGWLDRIYIYILYIWEPTCSFIFRAHFTHIFRA